MIDGKIVTRLLMSKNYGKYKQYIIKNPDFKPELLVMGWILGTFATIL